MLTFFDQEKQKFYRLLGNKNWVLKLAYLADTFDNINLNMQGKNVNIYLQLTKYE